MQSLIFKHSYTSQPKTNKMKRIFLAIAIVLVLLTSCRKEITQSDEIKSTNLEVKSAAFSSGTPFGFRDILEVTGLTQGYSCKMIATQLRISLDTVRFRIKQIYLKLHANSAPEAVAEALREQIV